MGLPKCFDESHNEEFVVRSIILKKQPWGEADELALFLGRDLGWLTGVAKNARKSRVRFGGHLEPLALVDLTLRPRKRDNLVWIDDAQLVRGYTRIRTDLFRVAWCSYLLELSSVLLPEANPDLDVFDFLLQFLELMESSDPSVLHLLLEEIHLLGLLGYAPRFDVCLVCGKMLEPGQDALFSASKGGACHLSCLAAQTQAWVRLSPNTLAAVKRGLDAGPRVVERIRLGKKGQAELRQALSTFVRYLRGEDIRSLVFLEKMGLL
jgi:DNA repair protein RecO (recombination protein O)